MAAIVRFCPDFDLTESVLFPHFRTILNSEIVEFLPYIFLIAALFLENHKTVTPAYQAFLPFVLKLALLSGNGNILALVKILQTYFRTEPVLYLIHSHPHFNAVLRFFQTLVQSNLNDSF